MNPLRSLLAVSVSVGIALSIAWLSQAPTTYARPADALLRLSWRVDALRVEECRRRTPEELEALAPHMRTPEVCTGGTASYELRATWDGVDILRDTLQPGGARGDRPIYVYRDVPVSPGRHAARVVFRALVPETFEAGDTPVAYEFEGSLDVSPNEVALITTDSMGSRLVRGTR